MLFNLKKLLIHPKTNISVRKLFFHFFVIFFLILLCCGCGTARVKVHKSPLFASYPLSVAVLPFTIKKNGQFIKSGTEKILRKVFYNYFTYLSYIDLSLEEIDKILKKNNVSKIAYSKKLPLKKLRNLLGVEAVIQGELVNSTNFTAGIYAETWLKAKMQMIDLKTGEKLWDLKHEELDHSSLVSPSFIDMVRQQMDNFNTEKAYYKLAERFAAKVVRKIPDPKQIAQAKIKAPKISKIFTNIQSNQILLAGDIIEVKLTGEPNLSASFDIGSWKFAVPLKETQPRVYTGSYLIKPEDQFHNALIIGRLIDKIGVTGKKALYGLMFSTANLPTKKANFNLPKDEKRSKN